MSIVSSLGIDPDVAEWQQLAKCRSMPPELFFEVSEDNNSVFECVSQCCSLCPVKEQCIFAGISGKESGVWGGVLLDRGVIVKK